ncbi:hypothetical protein AB3N59_19210 [Leptospira sp. WS92.C1]
MSKSTTWSCCFTHDTFSQTGGNDLNSKNFTLSTVKIAFAAILVGFLISDCAKDTDGLLNARAEETALTALALTSEASNDLNLHTAPNASLQENNVSAAPEGVQFCWAECNHAFKTAPPCRSSSPPAGYSWWTVYECAIYHDGDGTTMPDQCVVAKDQFYALRSAEAKIEQNCPPPDGDIP